MISKLTVGEIAKMVRGLAPDHPELEDSLEVNVPCDILANEISRLREALSYKDKELAAYRQGDFASDQMRKELAGAKAEFEQARIDAREAGELHREWQARAEKAEKELAEAKRWSRYWVQRFVHLHHAVYEAMTQSIITALTQEKLTRAQSWEPEEKALAPEMVYLGKAKGIYRASIYFYDKDIPERLQDKRGVRIWAEVPRAKSRR